MRVSGINQVASEIYVNVLQDINVKTVMETSLETKNSDEF